MRQVVMSSIEPAQVVELRPRRRLLIWIPAVAAVAIVILGLAVFLGGDPVGDVLGADDAVATELAATDSFTGDAPTVARIVYSESQGAAVVEFEGLTPVASDQVYQLWLIDDGVAVPAGLFNPDDRGSALVLISGEPNSGEVVGVTAEPSGGSTAPTGDVLFAAEI
jgi:anti-sigma-K factor RskA